MAKDGIIFAHIDDRGKDTAGTAEDKSVNPVQVGADFPEK